jgi:hypothetical protein
MRTSRKKCKEEDNQAAAARGRRAREGRTLEVDRNHILREKRREEKRNMTEGK